MLVLDSGAVTVLAERSSRAAAVIRALQAEGAWPPHVPSAVLIECLRGDATGDAVRQPFPEHVRVVEAVPERLARRAARLRQKARRGSAVDALVIACAEPAGTALTTDADDLHALATYANDVAIETI